MDRVNRKIEDFIERFFYDIDFEFQGTSKRKQESEILGLKYEYFVNAFEVFKFRKEIDIEETKRLTTGSLKGIDSLYLVLNGKFFSIPEKDDEDYADFINEIKKRLTDDEVNATFYFNQIKSEETNIHKFTGFCDTVYDVFNSEDADILKNKRVQSLKTVFELIAAKTENINLNLKYCSIKRDTKKINELLIEWKSELTKKQKELKSTKFKNVEIKLQSGQDYFSKLDNYNSPNKRKFELNKINEEFKKFEVDGAITYIGFLSLMDVLNLLKDEEGNFDDLNVFFDNIRYFQGDTNVNSKILRSLNTNGKLFHTLHNGIIITSNNSHFNAANGNLVIEGFSIVNGCQTCNMIWKWYENSYNETTGQYSISDEQLLSYKIPVKLIISSDYELRNKITEAANTQNPIKTINLIAISDTAKILESKFKELETPKRKEKLVFQRLPKSDSDAEQYLTISLEDVARAFYSTFGKEPNEVARSFGKLLDKKLDADDFLSDKKGKEYDINSYLLTSIAFNYITRFLKSRYNSLSSLRHHFLLLFFVTIDNKFVENNGKKLSKEFVENSLSLLDDKDEFEKICISICEFAKSDLDFFVDNTSTRPRVIPKSYYTEENTKKMLEMYLAKIK